MIDYLRVSYKQHITQWLEDCIKKSSAVPLIKESIVQYLNLIKKLTHQNLNRKMSKEIAEKITHNQNSFEAYVATRKTENDNEIYLNIVKTKLIPFF